MQIHLSILEVNFSGNNIGAGVRGCMQASTLVMPSLILSMQEVERFVDAHPRWLVTVTSWSSWVFTIHKQTEMPFCKAQLKHQVHAISYLCKILLMRLVSFSTNASVKCCRSFQLTLSTYSIIDSFSQHVLEPSLHWGSWYNVMLDCIYTSISRWSPVLSNFGTSAFPESD